MTRLTASQVRAAFTSPEMGIQELARALDKTEKAIYSYLSSNPQHFQHLGEGMFRLLPLTKPVRPAPRIREKYSQGYKEFFR